MMVRIPLVFLLFSIMLVTMLRKVPVRYTPEDVREILAKVTGIPVGKLSTEDEHGTRTWHRGYWPASSHNCNHKAIRRNSVGLSDAHRSMRFFHFNGHACMGKTKLSQAMTKIMGNEDAMNRLGMTQHQEAHTVNRLIGSSLGCVGHKEGGQLKEYVSLRPYSVSLFDEIEKAKPNVFMTLLQDPGFGRGTRPIRRDIKQYIDDVTISKNLTEEMPQDRRVLVSVSGGVIQIV